MRGPFDELPFRDISAEDTVLVLMAERGETMADVTWVQDVPMRAADFWSCIMTTHKHVYTLLREDWTGHGAYYVRVFVSRIDGHERKAS